MSDAAPHNEGALSVPVAATIAVGAAGLPAVLAGNLALSDQLAAAFLWAVATAIAVGVIAGLAARDRWRSGVVSASAFTGFMLANLALVKPAVLGVVSWCADHAARRPPNADTAPDEVMLLAATSWAAIPATLLAATALSALAGWAVTPLVRGDRPPRPSPDALLLAFTGGSLSTTIMATPLGRDLGSLAWTCLQGEHLSGWASAIGLFVFGGGFVCSLAVLWTIGVKVRATIRAGLLRRFTGRGGALTVILALSLAYLARKNLTGVLRAMDAELLPNRASEPLFLGVFAAFVWLSRPRIGVRPVNFATVVDAALLLAPTVTAVVAVVAYGNGALAFGPVATIIPLQAGRPPTAEEIAQTQVAMQRFAADPLASLYPVFAASCPPLLLYGLLRRRPCDPPLARTASFYPCTEIISLNIRISANHFVIT